MFPKTCHFQYQQELFTLCGNKCLTISENTILADVNKLVAFITGNRKKNFSKHVLSKIFCGYTLEYERIEI